MKKLFTLALACLMALSLAACGGTSGGGNDASQTADNGSDANQTAVTYLNIWQPSDKESVVRLSMTEDHVELNVRSDVNGSAVEVLQTFQFTGERLDVSFNSTFVFDAAKAIGSEDVSLCFLAEMKPFVVKNKQDDSIIELITPMRTY